MLLFISLAFRDSCSLCDSFFFFWYYMCTLYQQEKGKSKKFLNFNRLFYFEKVEQLLQTCFVIFLYPVGLAIEFLKIYFSAFSCVSEYLFLLEPFLVWSLFNIVYLYRISWNSWYTYCNNPFFRLKMLKEAIEMFLLVSASSKCIKQTRFINIF